MLPAAFLDGRLPLLQVRGARGAPSPSKEATHRESPVSRLAAIDFSKPARDAFDYALALSRHHGAELIAIQAVPPDGRLPGTAAHV